MAPTHVVFNLIGKTLYVNYVSCRMRPIRFFYVPPASLLGDTDCFFVLFLPGRFYLSAFFIIPYTYPR